jgi:lysophospholipase L1-like esterase
MGIAALTSFSCWRRVLQGPLLAAASLLLLAFLGEATARTLPFVLPSFRSGRFRQYDPALGISLLPNQTVLHARGCFEGKVVTNEWGMRDLSRALANSDHHLRIALLGDSVIEGAHVYPDQVVNVRMETLLHRRGYANAEVLNFGIAGIGTTQELLLYTSRVHRFHPDVVVLLFVSNDVMNNSSVIQPRAYGLHTWFAPYFNLGPNGQLVFVPVQRRAFHRSRSLLENHSALAYYLERIWARVDIHPHKWEGVPLQFGVFGDPPPDVDWRDAWLITEKVLTRLAAAVARDGSAFILLVDPDPYRIDPSWRHRFEMEFGTLPASFRADHIDRRLTAIAARNNISFDVLAPYFDRYRDAHGLQWPYFQLPCDQHYSALGHKVAAEAIVDALARHRLLPSPSAALNPPALFAPLDTQPTDTPIPQADSRSQLGSSSHSPHRTHSRAKTLDDGHGTSSSLRASSSNTGEQSPPVIRSVFSTAVPILTQSHYRAK